MKKSLILLFIGLSTLTYAQVGVNTTSPQGALDVSSATDGLLIPRVALTTTSSALPLTSPTISEIVYNTASVSDVTPGFYYWNGTAWVRILTSVSPAWNLTGNSGTTPGTNFIGNTDNKDFVIKTNNTQRTVVKADGTMVLGSESLSGTSYNANSGLRINIPNSNTSALSALNIKYRATPSLTNAAINVENDTQTAINQWGIFNSVVGLGTDKIGLENRITGGGNGNTYGVINRLDINNITNATRTHYGVFNTMSLKPAVTIYGQVYGNYNLFTVPSSTTHTNNIYGSYYEFNTLAASNVYGSYIRYVTDASSTGSKYGYFVEIPSVDAGTHYGVFSNVIKSGSYAGYFLGNVSIGTTSGNEYILPSSRGAIGQTMITDGSGNVSWSTPTSNIVTISTPDYTVLTTDSSVILTTAATGIITLPTAASSTGKVINLVNYSGADKTLSIAVNVGSGGTTTTTLINDTRMTIQSNGTDWYRIM